MLLNLVLFCVAAVVLGPIASQVFGSIFEGLGALTTNLITPATTDQARIKKEGSQAFLFVVIGAAIIIATWAVVY